jgi:hypothetical protein
MNGHITLDAIQILEVAITQQKLGRIALTIFLFNY